MFDKQNLVVQANKLIMAPQSFSQDEKKFIVCLTSKIKPTDKDFKSYRIKFDEYATFIGKDYDYVRQNLPKITKNIMRQILEIEDDEVLKQRSILIGADHVKGLGYVDVQFHPDLKDVLLDLGEKFTKYKLENVLYMSGKHSMRIFEIVKANEFKAEKKFRLAWSDIPKPLKKEFTEPDIQKLVGTEYKQFTDFEKRVLKPAQDDMRKHADVYFEYQKVKVSRYLCAIDFYIKENIPTVDHNQVSLFEMLPVSDKPKFKTPIEMAKNAAQKIEANRDAVCRMFQEAVKREYGVDFQLSMLEGISTLRISEVLPLVGSWTINTRGQHSVTKYIMKVLRGN